MKVFVKNQLGDKSVNMYLPMSPANAVTLMDDICEGTYKVYETLASTGTDTAVTSANDLQLQVRNRSSGKKTYLRFIAKGNLNPDEIQATLTGLTINGILIDEVVIIAFRPMAFA